MSRYTFQHVAHYLACLFTALPAMPPPPRVNMPQRWFLLESTLGSQRFLDYHAGSLPARTPPCCPLYTATAGSTVDSVAARASVAPTVLTGYNNLPDNATLTAGQTLQMPCERIIEYAYAQKAAHGPVPEHVG